MERERMEPWLEELIAIERATPIAGTDDAMAAVRTQLRGAGVLGPPSGGTPSGGTPSGGTPSGGTPSGGTPSGGTPSGGASQEVTPSGGAPSASGDFSALSSTYSSASAAFPKLSALLLALTVGAVSGSIVTRWVMTNAPPLPPEEAVEESLTMTDIDASNGVVVATSDSSDDGSSSGAEDSIARDVREGQGPPTSSAARRDRSAPVADPSVETVEVIDAVETDEVSESTLSTERRLIDRALAALRANAPHDALVALMAHERRFGHDGALTEERDRLVVEALLAAGHHSAARERAESFFRRHPSSTHADRVRQLLEITRVTP